MSDRPVTVHVCMISNSAGSRRLQVGTTFCSAHVLATLATVANSRATAEIVRITHKTGEPCGLARFQTGMVVQLRS